MDTKNHNTHIDKEKRIIYLCGEFNDDNISPILFDLINWIEDNNLAEKTTKNYGRKPIRIFIETGGGYISLADNLINIILNSDTPIYTYALGYCLSAGFLVFIAGHKRYAGKYSTLMYHQMSSSSGYDTCEYIKDYSEQLLKKQNIIEQYVVEQTKISKEKLEEIREYQRDWYLNSDEALKLGVATDLYQGL